MAGCDGAVVEVALRWRDLDHQGHVYHGAIVTLLDEARTGWLATWIGPVSTDSFVLVRLDVTFHDELLMADGAVRVKHSLQGLGTTSITMHERMMALSDGRTVASSDTVIVLWDAVAHAPRALTTVERGRAPASTSSGAD
jgi:acyl-CoA thioester hydrolase